MPVSYREMLGRCFLNLGEPHPAFPGEPVLWRALADNAQLMFNQALAAPPNWSTSQQPINLIVTENQDEYLLPAGNFGKDVLVETADDSNPYHKPRPVRRMSLQSAGIGGDDLYVEAYNSALLEGVKHTVQTMAFYRADGGVYVRCYPKPPIGAQPAMYKIWYELAEPNLDSDANNFIVPAGVPLLCLRASFTVLPHTRWSGFDDKQNAAKRKELAVTLASDKADHERQWTRYLATDRQAGLTVMRGFDDASYECDLGLY
jgi:hypothetical protein